MQSEAGSLLVAAGLISEPQLQQALQGTVQAEGTLSQHLVRLGFIQANDLAHFFSERLQIPLAQHEQLNSLPTFITSLLPQDVVMTYRMIPIMLDQGVLYLAMSDPTNRLALEEVSFLSGYAALPVAAADDLVEFAMNKYYGVAEPDPVPTPAPAPPQPPAVIHPSESDELQELFRPEKEEPIFHLTKAKIKEKPAASSIGDAIAQGIQELSGKSIAEADNSDPTGSAPGAVNPATPSVIVQEPPVPAPVMPEQSAPRTPVAVQEPSVPAPVMPEQSAPSTPINVQKSSAPDPILSEQPALPIPAVADQDSPAPAAALSEPASLPTPVSALEPPAPAGALSEPASLPTPVSALEPPAPDPAATITQATHHDTVTYESSPEFASALQRINQATQRDELASILIRFAQRLLRRCILFAVRKDILVGWMGSGMNLTDDKVKTIIIPLNTQSEFRTVCESHTDFFGSFERSTISDIFLSALGKTHPKQIVMIPICVRHKPVFLLYGDCGMDLGLRCDLSELHDLVQHTASSLEQIILEQKGTKKPT